MKSLALRYPANADNATHHAKLAVRAAWEEFDMALDYSPASLDEVDVQIESLREDGYTGEDVAEALFVLGCYVGEVMVRRLGGRWAETQRSPLRGISPWPMIVVLPGGSAWDPIGKAFLRLELGDSESIVGFFRLAWESLRQGPRP